ncbi:MAG: glycosyltransferase family 92 protein [Selenomonadaceae bacterium]|nr:glycosyltransferase family 92 protein [Selenomonadaceae bacterium]
MVDKNLFLYNFSITSIMKNEEPYVKEWLDYHLLAGADHFFIYDNDSTPEFKKILQPYIDAGIVTYTFYPGKVRQLEAYLDVATRFKFYSRYVAWIDGDEFIFPKSKSTLVEVADEIFTANPQASGLAANIHNYGSNGHIEADLTRGVLDRFTARADNSFAPPSDWAPGMYGGNAVISTIANPRRVSYFPTPHAPNYMYGCFAVNENGNIAQSFSSYPVSTEKIAMNHYHTKSREEYEKKAKRGNADGTGTRTMEEFKKRDYNDVFDDGIVKYRDARIAALIPDGNISKLFPDKQINYQRLFNALTSNLMPTLTKGTPQEFFAGKVENFLTCFNLVVTIKDKVFDDLGAKFFEEAALKALHRSLHSPLQFSDVFLLIDEMPKILAKDYPVVKDIRDILINIIPQVMMSFRANNRWYDFKDIEYKLNMLKLFKF